MSINASAHLKRVKNLKINVHASSVAETTVLSIEDDGDGSTYITIFGYDQQLALIAETIQRYLEQKNSDSPDEQQILNHEIESEIERRVTA